MLNKAEEQQIYTVRQARRWAEITQRAMANALGIDRTTYIKWEKKPHLISVPKAKQISSLTGVPFDRIFFGE